MKGVVLAGGKGDNLIENNIIAAKRIFEKQKRGAHIIPKEMRGPERLGCPQMARGKIIRMEEKPKKPKSNFAVTGSCPLRATNFVVRTGAHNVNGRSGSPPAARATQHPRGEQ